MKKIFLFCCLILVPTLSQAQTVDQIQSCNAVQGPFEVIGNAPWGYTFVMAQLVPASETDPTLVPHLYNGFTMQIDSFAEVDMAMGELLGICPNGTVRAGDKIYKIVAPSNTKLDKGNHVLHLWAWNLDENGQKRGGDIVNVPFVAVEPIPVLNRGPYAPVNVLIYKGTGNPPVPTGGAVSKTTPVKK